MSPSRTSYSKTQWLLILAGGCAAFGLLLKVSDLLSPAESPSAPHAGARQSAPRRVGESASPDVGAGHHGTADGEGATGSGPDGAPRVRRSGDPREWFGSGALLPDGADKLSPRAMERHAKREARVRSRIARREAAAALRASRTAQEPARIPVGGGAQAGAGGIGGVAGQQPAAGQPAAPPAAPAGTDLVFDSGAGTQYATDTHVEIPGGDKLAGSRGSISFWMQPEWGAGNQDDASFISLADSRLQVIKNVNFLRFEFTDDNGAPVGLGAPITNWQAGEWHQVATTWGPGGYSLYIDGQLVSTINRDAPFTITQGSKLFIGSDYPESRPVAPGTIGSVDVRNRTLGASEIANQFNQFNRTAQR